MFNRDSSRYSRPGFKDNPRKHQPRRTKTPPIPAKPCRVIYVPDNREMTWNGALKVLEFGVQNQGTVFPSRKKARIAIWLTAQKAVAAEGVDGREWSKQFEIVDA